MKLNHAVIRSIGSCIDRKGIQRTFFGITHAFGKSVHQGVSLHTDDNGVVADISVVLTDNAAVYASASALQDKIKKLIRFIWGCPPVLSM